MKEMSEMSKKPNAASNTNDVKNEKTINIKRSDLLETKGQGLVLAPIDVNSLSKERQSALNQMIANVLANKYIKENNFENLD